MSNNPRKVDTKWEFLSMFILFLKVNWWKIAILVTLIGLVMSGFTIKGKNFSCEKEPIKFDEVKK